MKLDFAEVQERLSHCQEDRCEQDNDGQLVFYTSIYRHTDGSFHDEKEPEPLPKHIVRVVVLDTGFPECNEVAPDCPYTRECANHCTAGDNRLEDGLTSDLSKHGEDWRCSKDPVDALGARLADGTLMMDHDNG